MHTYIMHVYVIGDYPISQNNMISNFQNKVFSCTCIYACAYITGHITIYVFLNQISIFSFSLNISSGRNQTNFNLTQFQNNPVSITLTLTILAELNQTYLTGPNFHFLFQIGKISALTTESPKTGRFHLVSKY